MNRQSLMVTCFILTFILAISSVKAVPGMINYQGKVDVSDQPFSGNGNFRFAIVNGQGSTNYLWSNDGNFPPTTNVQEAVENGIYNVILGNTPMTTIPTSVFENNDIYLRVWFNDGTHGLQQLAPDQKITSTGFAIKAEDANTLQGHASSSFANSTHSHSFTNITGTATDTQTPDTHTHAAGSIPASSINATGLDSDKVDGVHADQFLRSDQSDTMNGSLTVSNSAFINGGPISNSNIDPLFQNNGGTLLLGPADGTPDTATGGIFSGWQGALWPTIAMYVTRGGLRSGIRADSTNTVYIRTSDIDQVFVNSVGNVGIGTNNPGSYRLRTEGWTSSAAGYDLTSANANGNVSYEQGGAKITANTILGHAELDFITPAYDSGPIGFAFLKMTGTGAPYLVDNTNPLMVIKRDGNVGVGTANPINLLTVSKGTMAANLPGEYAASITHRENAPGKYGLVVGTNWGIGENFITNFGIYNAETGEFYSKFVVKGDGKVGIGTTTPGYNLQVEGNGIDAVAYNCRSGDIAEKLAVHPDYQTSDIREERDLEKDTNDPEISHSLIEPGTVVVITEAGIVPCAKHGDTSLAGIISTEPAIKMARGEQGEYVALAGKVPCKVTGQIKAGDLLTTSSLTGYAEKTTEFIGGAMVGKALENFDGESGVIKVWIGGI